MIYPVSVIVPIYNVEKYIERCVISLFEQDFKDIEYIFVNDCTPDNSMDILQKLIEKYSNRKSHIKIIHNKENRGSGASRKVGIENSTGEYTIQIDSDDWCELDMISSLYKKAKETGADIITCDFFMNYQSKEEYNEQDYSNNKDCLISFFVEGLTPAVWNKLIKRDLYIKNNIYPPMEISMSEDLWLSIRLFVIANSIDYVPKAFLHYWQENPNSLCANITNKTWEDLMWYSKTTQEFLEEKGLFQKYKEYFYMKYLSFVLWFSQGVNYKKNINYVSPEADRLKYLWQNPTIKIFN